MSGLDKITARILDESAGKAKAVLDEARKTAETITADGLRKTAEECERINKKAEAAVLSTAEKGQASAELRHKQILLWGKQELMTEVIDTARKRLDSLDDGEYREFIIKLFKKHLPSQDAELKLNARDKERLGESVLSELKSLAEQHGAKLSLSDEPCNIRNGFVLSYGGVEENCTVEALLEQSMEELSDKVRDILF